MLRRNAIRNFPAQSFHLILVNLFEKKPEQLLLAYHNDQYLICADNGLLTMILEGPPEMLIGLPLDKTSIRNTLYCTGVMGRAVQELSNGARLQDIGAPDPPFLAEKKSSPAPFTATTGSRGRSSLSTISRT